MKAPLPPFGCDDVSTGATSQEYISFVKDRLHDAMESSIFVCGMASLDPDDPCHGIFLCDTSLDCDTHMEAEFYVFVRSYVVIAPAAYVILLLSSTRLSKPPLDHTRWFSKFERRALMMVATLMFEWLDKTQMISKLGWKLRMLET
jgi:hypothetical protein